MTRQTALPVFCFLALFSLHASADTFDSDGTKIYYTVQGSGEPVVLIHGFLSTAAGNFGEFGIIDSLAESFEVVAIDNRGHGASSKPHEPDAYGDQMLVDVVNLLDHLGIDKANVVGYSMGGFIAQKLVMRYPERVIKAVIGGAGGTEAGSVLEIDTLAQSLESGDGIGPLVVALAPPGQPKPTPEEIAAVNEQFVAPNDVLAAAAAVRGFPELFDVTETELRANDIPLLYLVGDLDPLKAGVDGIRTIVSDAQFETIPNADHMTAFASPEFIRSISDFLSAN